MPHFLSPYDISCILCSISCLKYTWIGGLLRVFKKLCHEQVIFAIPIFDEDSVFTTDTSDFRRLKTSLICENQC
jgi:hypothetical protein